MAKAQNNVETTTQTYVAQDLTPIRTEISDMESNEARRRAEYEYDSVMVRGVFRRHDQNTDPVHVPWRKHKWEKITTYIMHHGQVHSIPRGVAIHLNENCKTPIYGQLPGVGATLATRDAAGNMPDIVGYVNRFSFSSLEFSREANVDSQVILASAPKQALITSASAPHVV